MAVESIYKMAISVCYFIKNISLLRKTVESVHQMAISVCVCMTIGYHVTYDSGDISPDGNISMCLHDYRLPRYVWQWRIFTKWQYQYECAWLSVTMLGMTRESIHQMAISVWLCMAICYHVTYDCEEYSPDGNICIYLHHEKLPSYIWQWRVFSWWQHLYVSVLRTVTILRIIVKIFHQMATSVFVFITNSYHIRYDSGEYSPEATSVCVCIRNSYHVTYYSE